MYLHTKRASGQVGVERCQWILELEKEGQVPAGLYYWRAKLAVGIEGHWMGCVHLWLRTLNLNSLHPQ